MMKQPSNTVLKRQICVDPLISVISIVACRWKHHLGVMNSTTSTL